MPRLRQTPLVIWLLLLALILVGGGLRVNESRHPPERLSPDAQAYSSLAKHLDRTGNYANRDGYAAAMRWPPGAPIAFAAAYKLNPGKSQDLKILRDAQTVIATALIPAVFLLGLALAGWGAGLAAAAIVAFYPPYIWAPSTLLSEPLGALLLTIALTALTVAHRRKRLGYYVAGGFFLGATILTRTDLMPAIFVACLVLVAATALRQGVRTAGLTGALVIGALLLPIVPWVAYASNKSDELVPVTAGGGSAFFVGTFLPGNGSTFDMKLALLEGTRKRHPQYAQTTYSEIPASVVLADVAARHPKLTPDQALKLEARENLRRYAIGDPVAFAGMMQFKVLKMWARYARGGDDSTRLAWTALHISIVLLAAFGLVKGIVRRRDPLLIAILMIILTSTAVHTLTVAHGRYNLPMMPVLIAGGCAGWVLARRARLESSSDRDSRSEPHQDAALRTATS